jgi:hypothetical protein
MNKKTSRILYSSPIKEYCISPELNKLCSCRRVVNSLNYKLITLKFQVQQLSNFSSDGTAEQAKPTLNIDQDSNVVLPVQSELLLLSHYIRKYKRKRKAIIHISPSVRWPGFATGLSYRGSSPGRRYKFFSLPEASDQLWNLPSLIRNKYWNFTPATNRSGWLNSLITSSHAQVKNKWSYISVLRMACSGT